VLQFHGYTVSSRSFFELSAFVSAGFAVMAMDCRGQGGKSEDLGGVTGTTVSGHLIMGLDDPLDQHLYVKIYSDVYLMSRLVTQLSWIDPQRLYVNGASQGAALAAVCAALNSNIKKAALLYPFLSDFERVFELSYDVIAYKGLHYYSRWYDPEGTNQAKMFQKLAYLDVRHFASRIRCEVLFGISLDDIVCLPSTQFAVYNALKCNKKHIEYPGKGHELIHDFDDRIIPFFELSNPITLNKQFSSITKTLKSSGITTYGDGKNPLIVYFNSDQAVGINYLRRFITLGYDVLAVPPLGDVITQKKLNQVFFSVSKLIDSFCADPNKTKIVVVGEAQGGALTLCYAGFDPRVSKVMVQSPLAKGISFKFVRKSSSKLKANVLFAYGGLEPLNDQHFYQTLLNEIKTEKKLFYYPSYIAETIDAFEDRKFHFINQKG